MSDLPVVRSPRGTWHAVWASGSREDGSLYNSYTLCGMIVGLEPDWEERKGEVVTCGNCKRVLLSQKYAAEAGK